MTATKQNLYAVEVDEITKGVVHVYASDEQQARDKVQRIIDKGALPTEALNDSDGVSIYSVCIERCRVSNDDIYLLNE